MNVEPMYLTIFLIAGGYYLPGSFLSLCTFFSYGYQPKYQELISLWYNFF